MSRIRTIKPDAFTSESLSRCTPLARWTFAGLWTFMDDAGKCKADTRLIKAALFPLDDATTTRDIDAAIGELLEEGCIHTFMSGGRQYLHAPEFNRHQKINRPSPSTLPPCPCDVVDSMSDHGTVSESSVTVQGGKGREGKGSGKEGEGEARTTSRRRPASGASPRPASSTPSPRRPPRKCPKHINDPDPPNCRACADARRAHDEWSPPTFSGKTTMCGEHPEHPARACPECAAAAIDAPANWRQRKSAK